MRVWFIYDDGGSGGGGDAGAVPRGVDRQRTTGAVAKTTTRDIRGGRVDCERTERPAGRCPTRAKTFNLYLRLDSERFRPMVSRPLALHMASGFPLRL